MSSYCPFSCDRHDDVWVSWLHLVGKHILALFWVPVWHTAPAYFSYRCAEHSALWPLPCGQQISLWAWFFSQRKDISVKYGTFSMRFSNGADAETNIQAVFTEQDRHVADVSWSVFPGRVSGRLCGEKHGKEAVVLSIHSVVTGNSLIRW